MSGADAAELLRYLREQRSAFVAFLETLTRCESPSNTPAAQAPLRDLLAATFDELDFDTTRLSGRRSGGHVFGRSRGRRGGAPVQLLLGHFDTVWPLGTLERMPFAVDDDTVRGPGVYDMKGGITQIVFALRALRELGRRPAVAPLVFLNSDEEIGSPESRRHIVRLARNADRVLVLEPSLGPGGKLKTTRKAVGRFTVTVHGKAAHAGLEPGSGASAILEMAHVIQTLFALNDPARGITVNVGTVDGGLRPNVVAPLSTAAVDVRVQTQADAESVEAAIKGLAPTTPGVRIEVEGRIGRPALEATPRNRALWRLAERLGRDVGLALDEGLAGGGSDGNLTSPYAATLDGLGAVGDGAHAQHEFLFIDKTLERTALLALLLLAPATAAAS